jgi:hypothetical protein
VLVFGLPIAVGLPAVSAGVAVLGALVEQRVAKCRGRASGPGTTWVLGLIAPFVSVLVTGVGALVIPDKDWLLPLYVPLAGFPPFVAGWMLLVPTRE